MTISRKELTAKAGEFINYLAEHHINAFLEEDSFRDYHCKIFLPEGRLILYHKPSKKTFSIGVHEYTGDKDTVEKLWCYFVFPDEKHVQGLCAYVDGSFMKEKCAWGLVLAQNDEILAEKNGLVDMSIENTSQQIAGEITAVLQALEYAKEHQVKSLTIFFDYIGLQYWAEHKWKTQSPISQYYVAKLMQYSNIKILWHKLAAHTGHPLNSKADMLARQAIEKY